MKNDEGIFIMVGMTIEESRRIVDLMKTLDFICNDSFPYDFPFGVNEYLTYTIDPTKYNQNERDEIIGDIIKYYSFVYGVNFKRKLEHSDNSWIDEENDTLIEFKIDYDAFIREKVKERAKERKKDYMNRFVNALSETKVFDDEGEFPAIRDIIDYSSDYKYRKVLMALAETSLKFIRENKGTINDLF